MEQRITCSNCGFQNSIRQRFCGGCGTKLVISTQLTSDTSASTKESVSPPGHRQINVKPTWSLAWGLYWRMLLIGLFVTGVVYLIGIIIMLAMGFTLLPPFGL